MYAKQYGAVWKEVVVGEHTVVERRGDSGEVLTVWQQTQSEKIVLLADSDDLDDDILM